MANQSILRITSKSCIAISTPVTNGHNTSSIYYVYNHPIPTLIENYKTNKTRINFNYKINFFYLIKLKIFIYLHFIHISLTLNFLIVIYILLILWCYYSIFYKWWIIIIYYYNGNYKQKEFGLWLTPFPFYIKRSPKMGLPTTHMTFEILKFKKSCLKTHNLKKVWVIIVLIICFWKKLKSCLKTHWYVSGKLKIYL